MKPDDTPSARDDVLFRELDDGCVLYDPATEKVHSLNATAAFIWCLLDGERSLTDVAAELCRATGADEATVLRDVRRAADHLRRQGLFK